MQLSLPSENLEEFKAFYKTHPKKGKGTSNKLYYDECPNVNKQTVKSWVFRLHGKAQPVETKPQIKKKTQSHIIPPEHDFIDDPNELLMDCAIRELNKQNPEVRWASILINILDKTKQLEAINKDRVEVQSKLKQYSTIDLINLRKKLTGNLQQDG